MKIDELKEAGFNEQEIGEYISSKRAVLLDAGFQGKEVNDYFNIDTNTFEFTGISNANDVSKKTGEIWDKGMELGIPTDIVRENYDDLFNVADPAEPPEPSPPEDAEAFGDLEMSAAPEHNDLMEKIFGYAGLTKPESYWEMNPIKRAAFDFYMAGRHIGTRLGGQVAKEVGLLKRDNKTYQDMVNSELVNNPQWYQKSPEVAGWVTEQYLEFRTMAALWKVTKLAKFFGWEKNAVQKILPFLSKEITVRGGTEVLPVLSKEGLKRLGKDTIVRFLTNAPENTAFLASWMGGKAVLTGEDISEATWNGTLWGLGISALMPSTGAVGKVFMATGTGKKVQRAASEAYTYLWQNYPRLMNAGRKPFSDEFLSEAKKWFKNQFGIEPNPAEEAQLSKLTRMVGDEITKGAQREAAVNAYWNSGKEAAKDVSENIAAKTTKQPIPTPEITSRIAEKPPGLPIEAQMPAIPAETTLKAGIEAPAKLSSGGGVIVYHGTEADIKAGDVVPDKKLQGIYTTTSKEVAGTYGKNVFAYQIKPDAKVLDLSDGEMLWQFMKEKGILEPDQINNVDLQNYVKNGEIFQYDISSKTGYADDVVKTAKSMGYDVVNIPDRLPESQDNIATIIINKSAIATTAKPDIEGQMKIDEFVNDIKKPKRVRGKLEPGVLNISGVTEAVKEVVDNGVNYVKETYETAKDAIEALQFYPNVPMELRNAIRTDIIGAGNQAGHNIYGKLSPSLLGNLGRDDIEKAAQIFYAKDEIARTKAGKGNPELSIEDAQANYDELVRGSSPEVLRVVENLEKIQKKYTDVLVERGLIDADAILEDYARHYVLDYTPDWAFKRGLPPLKLRTPFKGYTKEAKGTTKEYARTMESILFSFYEKELDNIVADFIEEQTAKYNILPNLPKEKKAKLFGVNERGTPNLPKPNKEVTINGKRYRAFSPDSPFARTFYRTENGEMAMGGYKHVSLIPEDIYNAFNSFSQRGGAIIYHINQITRFWKSMAILSHYPSFNINNIIGDTFMALMQHPEPEKFIAEYSTALNYLTGKGKGKFYDDVGEFIRKNDIVKGALTATELASFRNSSNPLSFIIQKLQQFSEFRESINRVAYAASLLRAQQEGRGGQLVKAHDWINTTGLDELPALGKIARDVEADYKWVSKNWSRYVSGMVAPFGTWYAKMSSNFWRWASKHWGKALITMLAAPVASTIYNDRSKESRELERTLPDSIRNRVHFTLGKNPDGTTRVLSLQLPQDALIGTKIFTIATAYANRVVLGEMTAEEAAIKTLKETGYRETKGMLALISPVGRFIIGLGSADRKDPYDKSPIYSKDPKDMTAWEYRKQTLLYGIKCMTPFLSASISSYEKGLPQDMAWRQTIETLAWKRALGFYDINPKGEVVRTLDDGRIVTLTWDDNAKIEWIYQQESAYLDDFEDAFVARGKNPDEFYQTKQAQKPLLKIHKLWNKFAPELNKDIDDKTKAEFVVGQLGERLVNRIYSAGTLSKWYQVKLDRAKTDEEKTKLGQEYKRLMEYKIEEAIKKQPKTSRQVYMSIKIKDSNMPLELLWEMP